MDVAVFKKAKKASGSATTTSAGSKGVTASKYYSKPKKATTGSMGVGSGSAGS